MKSFRTWLLLVALLLPVGLVALAAPAPAGNGKIPRKPVAGLPGPKSGVPLYDPDAVLVEFQAKAPLQNRLRAASRIGLEADPKFHSSHFARLKIGKAARAARQDVMSVIAQLRQDPSVRVAEPDYYRFPMQAQTTPNDDNFVECWQHENYGQATPAGSLDADMDTLEAWLYDNNTLSFTRTGPVAPVNTNRVLVGLLDSGIDFNHQDFYDRRIGRDNNWINTRENNGTGGADDDILGGNGLVDDTRGWDWANNNNNTADYTAGTQAVIGHGTTVAGVIGAVGNNTVGIAGVCWDLKLMPLKIFLSDQRPINNGAGATAPVSAEIRAIDYAIDRKVRYGENVRILNCSYGARNASVLERDAFLRARNAGILVVAAAGNADGFGGSGFDNDSRPFYPASYNSVLDNVISVAATTSYDTIATYSNYGATTVDIAAPGDTVLTTWVPNNAYTYAGGTSIAAGMVTGAAALVWSQHPTFTYGQVKQFLLNTVDHPTPLAGRVRTGRLNVNAALAPDPAPPGTPTALDATGRSAHALEVSWIASGDDGSTGTAARYDLRYRNAAFGPITAANFNNANTVQAIRPTQPVDPPLPAVSGTKQSYILQGLTEDTDYYVALKAFDKAGSQSGIISAGPFRTLTLAAQAGNYTTLFLDRAGDGGATFGPFFTGTAPWAVATTATQPTEFASTPGGRSYSDSVNANYANSLTGLALTQNLANAVPLPPSTSNPVSPTSAIASPNLTFWVHQNLAPDGDHVEVEASTNSGVTWTLIPTATFPVDSSTANDAMVPPIDLTQFSNQSVLLRFRLYSNGSQPTGTFSGVWLDDITIQAENIQPYGPQVPADPTAVAGPPGPVQAAARAEFIGGKYVVHLNWKDNSGAISPPNSDEESGFRVERFNPNTGNYEPIRIVPGVAGTGTTVSVTDDNNGAGLAANTTYDYLVYAFNLAGDSNPAFFATSTRPPFAPSNLTALARQPTPGNYAIDLTWNDNGPDTVWFVLERSLDNSFGSIQRTVTVVNDGSFALPYTDSTGLAAGTTYYYRVKARNLVGDSGYSNTATVSTALPTAPSGLTAVAQSGTSVLLSWTDNGPNTTQFILERSTDNFATFPANTTSIPRGVGFGTTYTDSPLTADTVYYYRIKSRNAVGDSAYSPVVAVKTSVPANVTALTVTTPAAPAGRTQLQLNWTYTQDPLRPQTSFRIERSTDNFATFPANTTVLSPAAAGIRTATDTGLAPNTTYYYRIAAQNNVGSSGYFPATGGRSGTTLAAPPVAPTLNTAAIIAGPAVHLVWTDNSDTGTFGGAEQFWKVFRKKPADAAFAQVGSNIATTTGPTSGATVSFDDTTAVAGNTYIYMVRANGNGLDSSDSNTLTVSFTVPATPGSLQAQAQSDTKIKLTWVDNASNELNYQVERFNTGTSTWQVVTSTLPANTVTYTDDNLGAGLSPGTAYQYRVKASNSVGLSGASNTAAATTYQPPSAPSNLSARATSATVIALTWTDTSSTETGFEIWRKQGAGGTYALWATVSANVTSIQSTALSAATTYYFKVRSFIRPPSGPQLNSAFCPEAFATTFGVPAPPSNLTATALSSSQILLAWDDNSTDEANWRVERLGPTGFTEVKLIPSTTVATTTAGTSAQITFTDKSLSPLTTYTYRVRAANSVGPSGYSNQDSATTPSAPTPPSGMTATPLSGARMQLSWTDNSGNESGFQLERKDGATAAFRTITPVEGALGANTTSCTDAGLTPGVAYYYRIRAFRTVNGVTEYSGYSNVAGPATAIR